MGASMPTGQSPNRHVPRSSHLVRAACRQVILNVIDATGLTPKQIRDIYRTFRKGYIQALRDGECFGIDRMFSICESVGKFPVISFVDSPKAQAAMMNVLIAELMRSHVNILKEAA